MKKIVLFLLLSCSLSFSQNSHDEFIESKKDSLRKECLQVAKEMLNLKIKSDFNAYVKGYDLYMDLDIKTDLTYSNISDDQKESFQKTSKSAVYHALTILYQILYEGKDYYPKVCDFDIYKFRVIYHTQTNKDIVYVYWMNVIDFLEMRKNLNTTDIYKHLVYKPLEN